jgi:hypothetical protein
MNKIASACGAFLVLGLLAGCADTGTADSGASITRFHLGQPIARGEISVEASDPAETGSLEFSQYSVAVERELSRLGWTITQGKGRSEQVAIVHVEQVSREAARRGGFSIGIGGGTGGFGRHGGVGVGGGATIPIGRTTNQLVATQLSVRLQRRSDATVAWEGRAETEARLGTPLAGKGPAVDRLAAALFRDFPGESGRTIRVR